MQKRIVKVMPVGFGHLMLEFEDGVKKMVHRGDHEAHQPKVGDMWPPDGHEPSYVNTNGTALTWVSGTTVRKSYRYCYPNRIGNSTPSPRTNNQTAGAGVPTGRTRRCSRTAFRGSRSNQRL